VGKVRTESSTAPGIAKNLILTLKQLTITFDTGHTRSSVNVQFLSNCSKQSEYAAYSLGTLVGIRHMSVMNAYPEKLG
jgi:hypothetical protein